jgi:GNAT superfamily N-acetyltransferase
MSDVRLAHPGDLDAVADSLGRAFAEDPVWTFVVPGIPPEVRAERLRRFFRTEARQRARLASVWTTPQGEAAAIWAPPGRWRPSFTDGLVLAASMLRAGRLHAAARLPVLTRIEKAHPRQPHWYLEALGTDPPHQGTGLGTALLAPVLERCDTEGRPAYLESSKEANVPFYERFGFVVTGELALPRGGPTLYPMWREPR